MRGKNVEVRRGLATVMDTESIICGWAGRREHCMTNKF